MLLANRFANVRHLQEGKAATPPCREQCPHEQRPTSLPISSGRRASLMMMGLVAVSTVLSQEASAEDTSDMVVEVKPETRPLKVRTERAVAIRDEKDKVIANGILWDHDGTIVTSYITFKDLLRKQARLTGKVGSTALGSLSILGFDPTLDIAVFQSEVTTNRDGLETPLEIVTGNYVVGQSVLALVRDDQGTFISSGIVSGTERTIMMANGVKNKGLLQTDCPISLVSAGAGAWTEDGKLLGIFTPGNVPFASFRSDSGVNFIQTSAALMKRVPELTRHGSGN